MARELARVLERRRAVALAAHYRRQEGLSTKEIARRLGRAPATVRAYLSDPTAARARQVKERYRGSCSSCGEPTSGAGPREQRTLCARCNGQASAKWDDGRIEAALRAWHRRYGTPASSTDLSLYYARKRAPHDAGRRLDRLTKGWEGGSWPAASVVQWHFGTVKAANRAALHGERPDPA